MIKRTAAIAAAGVLLLSTAAMAEVYEGTTVAKSTETIMADCGGTVSDVYINAGEHVNAGDNVASLRTEKTFASENGTVARVTAAAGDDVNGTVVEVSPDYLYEIYCTVDDAYESVDTELVHIGETVYIKCTYDGTHRGVGVITSIDGSEYRVRSTGGELYIGETVYLYRDEEFTKSLRVGIGTVVGSSTVSYDSQGTVTGMYVSAGDYVEEGQLLYETVEDGKGVFTTETTGIVTAVNIAAGDRVEANTAIAEIVPDDEVSIEISVAETDIPFIEIGDTAYITYACDEDEDMATGTVSAIAQIAENGYFTVQVTPDVAPAYIGMSVEVRIND